MNGDVIYLDDQGGRQMQVLREDVSPCILLNGAKAHALIVCETKPKVLAFAQNTREEVRILGDDGNVAGCVSAESGTHQTTYICTPKHRDVPHRTITKQKERVLGFDSKLNQQIYEEVSSTICLSNYKEPPAIIKRETKRNGN